MFARFGRCARIVVLCALLCVCCAVVLPACGAVGSSDEVVSAIEGARPVTVHVTATKGTGSMGLLSFASRANKGLTHNDFQYVTASTPSDITEGINQQKIDIAVVPCEIGTRIYNEGTGLVQVASVASTGGLRVVTADRTVQDLDDLSGRTVLLTGAGTTTEYVVRLLLDREGLAEVVTLEYLSDASRVVAALSSDRSAVAILPEPYATAATVKDESLQLAVDLSDAWREVTGEDGSYVSNVTLVRTSFAQSHPEAVAEFLAEQAASSQAYRDDPDTVAQLAIDAGLVDSIEVATLVFPNCEIVCLTGDEMVDAVSGYLDVIYNYCHDWVGPTVPGDDFYYQLPAELAADGDDSAQ